MARLWRATTRGASLGRPEEVLADLLRGGAVGVTDDVRVELEHEPWRAVAEPVLRGPRIDPEGDPGGRCGVAPSHLLVPPLVERQRGFGRE